MIEPMFPHASLYAERGMGEMKLNEHGVEKLKRAAVQTVDKRWECYV